MAPNISWLSSPITESDIRVAAVNFRDPNVIHHCPEAAKAQFGTEATGIVAPGAFIIGLIGGEIARQFGPGTTAHCLSDIKLQRCFCASDELGHILTVEFDQTKCGSRFVHLNIELFRRRENEIVPACRKTPIKAEICIPAGKAA